MVVRLFIYKREREINLFSTSLSLPSKEGGGSFLILAPKRSKNIFLPQVKIKKQQKKFCFVSFIKEISFSFFVFFIFAALRRRSRNIFSPIFWRKFQNKLFLLFIKEKRYLGSLVFLQPNLIKKKQIGFFFILKNKNRLEGVSSLFRNETRPGGIPRRRAPSEGYGGGYKSQIRFHSQRSNPLLLRGGFASRCLGAGTGMLRRESPPYPPCPRALASKPLLKKGALRQAGNKVKRGGD